MRWAAGFAVRAGLAAWLGHSHALADHCHRPPPDAGERSGATETEAVVRIEARGVFATFDNEHYRGSYEGLDVAGAWSDRRWRLEGGIPLYRLLKNGEIVQGPGDALLGAAITVWNNDSLRVGAELALALPTGDADAELGMGHVMLVPSGWGSLHLGTTWLSARLGFATALDDDPKAEHGAHGDGASSMSGLSPLVAPMNRREISAAVFVTQGLWPDVRARLGVDVAVPTADGRVRNIASAGLLFVAGWFDSRVEVELPLRGNPFDARASTALAVRW